MDIRRSRFGWLGKVNAMAALVRLPWRVILIVRFDEHGNPVGRRYTVWRHSTFVQRCKDTM